LFIQFTFYHCKSIAWNYISNIDKTKELNETLDKISDAPYCEVCIVIDDEIITINIVLISM